MSTLWDASRFNNLVKPYDACDIVVKAQYNGTLKRFSARVNGSHFDHNLAAIRFKIASAFKFSSDVEFILTYTDEDGDVVMLDDDNDLRDAAVSQMLNPLRINVQLKDSNAEALKTKQQASNSISPSSAALKDQLAQVKSAIDEAMKFVPEQSPAVLAKLSHDLRSRAVSSVPSLAELLDRRSSLMTPKGNMQTSSGPVYGSSCSFDVEQQASRKTSIEHEDDLMAGSASQPSDMQNAPGLKSVLPEDQKAQVEQAQVYHSVDSLNSTSSGGKKSDHKGSTVAESKGRCASESKGKSITSSALPAVSASTYAATPIQQTPASVSENKSRYWPTYGSNGLFSGGLQSRCASSVLPHNHQLLGSSGNINSSPFSRPANMYGPSKLGMPLSLGTCVPSKDGLYPIGNSYKYDVTSPVISNPEWGCSFGSSYNYGSIPQHALHKWIQCNRCGVTPIVGPRYKSNVKGDYDLCGACFSHIGNDSEYTRLDKPASVNNQKLLGHLQPGELKLECSFVTDVTVPDGTSMAPLNFFTKVWRLRNSGCTIWPFGTKVVWVGGDQFAVQNSVKLGISMNGIVGSVEVDVAVDFVAPMKPGRYASYWRLASPSGTKFGQLIWVLIQVEGHIQTNVNKLPAAINQNLPPSANSTSLKSFIDSNSMPMDPFFQYPVLPRNRDFVTYLDSESEPDSPTAPNFQYPKYGETFARFQKPIVPKESEPASSTTLPSIPAAVKQVQIPTTDCHAASAGPALASMAAPGPAPETIPLPKSVSFAVPVSAPGVPAPASLPGYASTSVPTSTLPDEIIDEIIHHKEEKLLKELAEFGFTQVSLNKEILRHNKYDLEQSVLDLCSLDDWEPLLGDLRALGFTGSDMI